MPPTLVGLQSATGVFQALPPSRAWFEFVASAKSCSSLRVGHLVGSSGTLERRVDPTLRIEVHVSILISKWN